MVATSLRDGERAGMSRPSPRASSASNDAGSLAAAVERHDVLQVEQVLAQPVHARRRAMALPTKQTLAALSAKHVAPLELGLQLGDRHEDGAPLIRRVRRDHPLEPVLRDDRYAVAATDTQVRQARAARRDAAREVIERDPRPRRAASLRRLRRRPAS